MSAAEEAAEETRQGLFSDLGGVLSIAIKVGVRVGRSALVWAIAYAMLRMEPYATNDLYLSLAVAALFTIGTTRPAANASLTFIFVLAALQPESTAAFVAAMRAVH